MRRTWIVWSITVLVLTGVRHQGMAQCRGTAKPVSKKAIAKKTTVPSHDYHMVVSTDGMDNPDNDGSIISYELRESSLTIALNRKAGTLTTTRRDLQSTMSGDKFTIDKRNESKVERMQVGSYEPMVFKTTDGGDIQLTIRKK